ncbi:hypothetical protein [Streptomyces beihaiensis]|uniref:Uncharacterized protein n=1 Tax=Streptomyces beihaiensis TaxID=2984495 RepID=A0ABT3TTD9_9ACTN|nr:hypothetical protein [Streptomyces beihaiensis]MCX3060307.1 hypothetical protein [Streptomyces beihaiensis]
MYLARVTVDMPGCAAHSAELLHRQIRCGAAGTDNLQHTHIEVHSDFVVFSLYVQALDLMDAARVAEQLCCRTMASLVTGGGWSVRSTEVGP